MRFTAPFALFLLFLVPVLGALAVWWRRRLAVRLAALSRRATAAPARSGLQIGLLLGALAALIVALSGPRWGRGEERFLASGRNLVIALDVSNSMLAPDVRPNRLGRAKADLQDLLGALRGDRVALLAFRGNATLLCPFTTDRAFLGETLDDLAPDRAPAGETDLADAIRQALDVFEPEGSDHNAIVLVTDGEDLAGEAEALAKEAGARGIPIFAVGVGSPEGAVLPGISHEGKPVVSKLDEATLRAVAAASGGAYIPLAGTGAPETTLGDVYRNHLARIEADEARAREVVAYADRTPLFATLAAVLALAAACLSPGRAAWCLAALLLPLVTAAQSAHDLTRGAIDLLDRAAAQTNLTERLELREQAAEAFGRALRAAPGDLTRRNVARALEGLPALRAEARQEAARAANGQTPLPQLARALLDRQRELAKRPESLAALPPAERIAQAEAFAQELREQADRWVPVLDELPNVFTNASQRLALEGQAQAAQAALDALADRAERLTAESAPIQAGEPFAYDLWRTFADPQGLLNEAIALSDNAIAKRPPLQPARADLPEAGSLTRQFQTLFPQWAEQWLQQAAQQTGEDGKPAFTEEDRDAILRLLDETLPLFQEPIADASKAKIAQNLGAIRERLPRQSQQQNQDQQQNQRQSQSDSPQQPQQEQQSQQSQAQPQPSEEEAKEQDLEALLQRAVDRSKRHEAEKRRAAAPLPPSARDW